LKHAESIDKLVHVLHGRWQSEHIFTSCTDMTASVCSCCRYWKIALSAEKIYVCRHNAKDEESITMMTTVKQTPWPESANELYRPSDRRLSAKLVLTFVDGGCQVVSVTDPYGRILDFLDRSSYFFFQVAPQLYSRV
jgi:hypothetical protein